MTLEDMIARRDALLAARFRGVRTVDVDGRRITYASDAEMAAYRAPFATAESRKPVLALPRELPIAG